MDIQKKLNKKEKSRLIIDYFHRIMMHHTMWFSEVQHQLGKEKALEIMSEVYKKSYALQMKRLGKILNLEMDDDVPVSMMKMQDEELDAFKEAVAVNWLANDGIWFQAVELKLGMFDAKRCNDSCWGQFSPFEAWSIKRMLDMEKKPGLEGLKIALQYRLYAAVNKQSVIEETDNSFVFLMNDCRVQSARRRKGMDDYPCKSAGIVEYRTFAEAIDADITTECIACPPDDLERDYYCGWKFTLNR
jgi:Family of unknown function (DUF6125)